MKISARRYVMKDRWRVVLFPGVRHILGYFIIAAIFCRIMEGLALIAVAGYLTGRTVNSHRRVAVVRRGHARIAGGQGLRIASQIAAIRYVVEHWLLGVHLPCDRLSDRARKRPACDLPCIDPCVNAAICAV